MSQYFHDFIRTTEPADRDTYLDLVRDQSIIGIEAYQHGTDMITGMINLYAQHLMHTLAEDVINQIAIMNVPMMFQKENHNKLIDLIKNYDGDRFATGLLAFHSLIIKKVPLDIIKTFIQLDRMALCDIGHVATVDKTASFDDYDTLLGTFHPIWIIPTLCTQLYFGLMSPKKP